MASEKLSRDNAAAGEKVHVERERVPKMATHFESLTVKDPAAVGGVGVESGIRKERESDERKEEAELLKGIGKFEGNFGEEGEGKGLSNEEVSGYRQQAQQGSIDALRAAEERYNQAKATAASTLKGVKDTVVEKGTQAKDSVLGKGAGGAHTTPESVGQKGGDVKDTFVGKGGDVKDTALKKGTQAKDTLAEGAQKTAKYVAEKGGVVKDTALEKGAQARDTLAQGAQTTAQYVAEKGGVVKDTALEKGAQAKEETVTMAGKAKDAVVGAAVGATDRAAVAGWTVAQYATELTVEGTKKAADMAKGVAGFAGEKVGFAKDKVVETEESVRDYAARKKEEAKRDIEAKKMGQQKVGMGEQGTQGGQRSMVEEVLQKPKETIGEFFEGGEKQQNKGQDESGGVLQAIGETIVEIAHTTKDLVIGQDEIENQGEKTTTMMGQRTQQSDQQKL